MISTRRRRAAAAAVTAGLVATLLGLSPTRAGAIGDGGTSFSGPTHFNVGSVPWLVETGDINRDGKPDIVAANAGSFTVRGRSFLGLKGISVLLNKTPTGGSTPSFSGPAHFAAGNGTTGVDIADFDGDGVDDVVGANIFNTGAQGVSVLRNTTPSGAATPTLEAPLQFASGVGSTVVRAADVNSDGRPDIVTGDAGVPFTPGMSVLLNTTAPGGAISFSAPTHFAGGLVAEGLTVGDINNDGRVDALLSHTGSSNVTTLLNTTAPGATTPSFVSSQEFVLTSTGIDLGDFDGDGRLDFAAAMTTGGVTVKLNRTEPGSTTASFGADTFLGTMGLTSEGVAVADYDGDGRPDVGTINDFAPPGYDVAVLTNRTAAGVSRPTFAGPDGYRAGWGIGTNAIASDDFNGDGRADIVTGNVPSLTIFGMPVLTRGVSVLLNTTG